MSSLKERVSQAVKEAMKARDSDRLTALRLMLNEIKKREIDSRKELTDSEIEKIFQTMGKQISESYEQAKGAGRDEAAAEAKLQADVLKEFLPEQMSEAEVEAVVVEVIEALKASGKLPEGPRAMGPVMGGVIAKVGSRAEGKIVQQIVKQKLA